MTLVEAVVEATRTLAAAGIPADEARRDAARLARHLLQWDAAAWFARRRDLAPEQFVTTFSGRIARRARREPLDHITGEREFYGRMFRVTPDVLIPRPETELVVDEALRLLGEDPQALAETTVVDAGTGSGCLAVTLALERPEIRVVALEASQAAVEVACSNAQALGAINRIAFRVESWIQGLERAAPVAMIVANPPYVPERDRPDLAPEVRDYEPAAALFAGPDGLDAIRALVPAAARALAPGGWLVMEIGAGQASDVSALVESTPPLSLDRIVPDLQSIPRVVIAHVPLLSHHRG